MYEARIGASQDPAAPLTIIDQEWVDAILADLAQDHAIIEQKAEIDLSGVMEKLDKLDWDKINREARESKLQQMREATRFVGTNVQVNVKW